MQRTKFDHMNCSIARTINIIGEWWTPLILRDVFYGVRRFDLLRRQLGISRKVLTDRLNTLVENKILDRVQYQQHPQRFEYQLTEQGKELFPIIVLLMTWGNKWVYENSEPPLQLADRETGEVLRPLLISATNGQEIRYENAQFQPGSPMYEDKWQELQQWILDKPIKSSTKGEG